MLFSVVKHLGSGRTLKKQGGTLDSVLCFLLYFFCSLLFPVCKIHQNRALLSLLQVCSGIPFKFGLGCVLPFRISDMLQASSMSTSKRCLYYQDRDGISSLCSWSSVCLPTFVQLPASQRFKLYEFWFLWDKVITFYCN